MKSVITALTLALAVFLGIRSSVATAEEITGAGSTFVYPLLAKWSDDYSKQTSTKINYQSIG